MKSKLRSLYRNSGNKVTPTAAADHGGYTAVLINHNNKLIVNQEKVSPPQISKHSVSLYLPSPEIAAAKAGVNSYNAAAARMDTLYGGAVDDEAVDRKAADYISSVRARFSIEYDNHC